MQSTIILGVDVAKTRLDGHIHPTNEVLAADNTAEGIAELLARAKALGAETVAMESSGGYGRALARAADAQGMSVIIFQPLEVRSFATLTRQKAKTDAIDAALIAACAAQFGKVRPVRSEQEDALAEMLTCLQQISADIAQERTRFEAFSAPDAIACVKRKIAFLQAEKRELLKALRLAVHACDGVLKRVRLLSSMPGIGFLNAVSLAVRLPELGAISNKAIAKLVGVAPFADDSGQRSGKRGTRAGRDRVRTLLYMAAMSAIRCNPIIKALHQRLINAGKPHKVAIVAAIRKMVVSLNAMIRSNQPWRDITETAPP